MSPAAQTGTSTRDPLSGLPPQVPQHPSGNSGAPSGDPGATSPEPAGFPDASGSLSSILASLGDGEADTPAQPAPPLPPAPGPGSAPPPPAEGENPYPDIMLMPLPRQDALRIKWGLGNGLPGVTTLSEEELRRLAAGATPGQKSGQLRLYGMLPTGAPWEARLSLEELQGAPNGIIIGRDPGECGIVISEDSVSRKHALLEMAEDGPAISDLDSRNGTTVDERRLMRYDRRVPLYDGSTINLGDVTIRVEILV